MKTLLRFVPLLGALFGVPSAACAQSPRGPGERRIVIPAAAKVDLSHLGVHTHENFIRFATGGVSLARLPGARLVAHCRYSTDHAAVPPGLGALTQDAGPVPTLGPIERWSTAPDHSAGRGGVRVTVPTRFANWVAGQTAAVRRRYQNPHSYSLEIEWQGTGGG